jgi:hypothetical protein
MHVCVPLAASCQQCYTEDIHVALSALKTTRKLAAKLLEAAQMLTEVNLHMVSQISTAGAFVLHASTTSTPAHKNFLRSAINEEEEDRDNQTAAGATPIDLAAALESACWDLDFLVRSNAYHYLCFVAHYLC